MNPHPASHLVRSRLLEALFCAAVSLTSPASGAESLLFQDRFAPKPGAGWSWEREDSSAWRSGPTGLEIRVQPGNMWGGANNAKNVLVRPIPVFPDASTQVSVTFSNAPTAQWEQADLTWFYDDSNMVKLGQELVTGRLSIVMGREENDRARTVAIIPLDDHRVELRLVAFGNHVRGQFRTRHWEHWRDAGECDLPVKGEPKASLQFYNGPANEAHWIRVNDFAVHRVPAELATAPRNLVAKTGSQINPGSLAGRGAGRIEFAGERASQASAAGLPWTLLVDSRALTGDAKASSDLQGFRHPDGTCGWTWNRRASSVAEPLLLGLGTGQFVPGNTIAPELGTAGKPAGPIELQTDAVTWLGDDRGQHTLSARIALSTDSSSTNTTHLIAVAFDWYGPAASVKSMTDGAREYEFLQPKAAASPHGPRQFDYRIVGFRGVPPRVILDRFLSDAVGRGLPSDARLTGIWFGNEVWDGSMGGTHVGRLALVLNGRTVRVVPVKP